MPLNSFLSWYSACVLCLGTGLAICTFFLLVPVEGRPEIGKSEQDIVRWANASLLDYVCVAGDALLSVESADDRLFLLRTLEKYVSKVPSVRLPAVRNTLDDALGTLRIVVMHSGSEYDTADLWSTSRERLVFTAAALRQSALSVAGVEKSEMAQVYRGILGILVLALSMGAGMLVLHLLLRRHLLRPLQALRTLSGAQAHTADAVLFREEHWIQQFARSLEKSRGNAGQESEMSHAISDELGQTGGCDVIAGNTVLLVEDSPLSAEVTKRILFKCGFDVQHADSGVSALNVALKGTYSLALVDLTMPGLSGYETARRLRRCAPRFWRLPIVALTASESREVMHACRAAEFNAVIRKPLTVAVLQDVFAKVQKGTLSLPALHAEVLDDFPMMADRRVGADEHVPSRGQSTDGGDLSWAKMSVLDSEGAMRELELTRTEYAELIRPFMAAMPSYGEALRLVQDAHDFMRVAELAHRIKGECANVGAFRAKRVASNLEAAALRGDDNARSELLRELLNELDALHQLKSDWQ